MIQSVLAKKHCLLLLICGQLRLWFLVMSILMVRTSWTEGKDWEFDAAISSLSKVMICITYQSRQKKGGILQNFTRWPLVARTFYFRRLMGMVRATACDLWERWGLPRQKTTFCLLPEAFSNHLSAQDSTSSFCQWVSRPSLTSFNWAWNSSPIRSLTAVTASGANRLSNSMSISSWT